MKILFLFWMFVIIGMAVLATLKYVKWETVMMTAWVPFLFLVISIACLLLMGFVGMVMLLTFLTIY